MERFKALLVAQRFSQKPEIDYDGTFSPVAKFESVRIVIALAVQNDLFDELHRLKQPLEVTLGDG